MTWSRFVSLCMGSKRAVVMPKWGEDVSQAYLEEMAAMLIQAQGDGNSQAGQRLQRLTTELVRIDRPSTWASICSASRPINFSAHQPCRVRVQQCACFPDPSHTHLLWATTGTNENNS